MYFVNHTIFMKNYLVRLYQKDDFEIWNSFISEAKNATFLFHRNFMEYHSDRFIDFSMMVFEQDKLVAVMPANKVENEVFSHQGLTYGGLVLGRKTKVYENELIFENIIIFLKQNKISALNFKQIPSFYFEKNGSEIDYFLIKNGAKLVKKELNLAIDYSKKSELSKSKLKPYKNHDASKFDFIEENEFISFWKEVLVPTLSEKYETKPVHSIAEINLLKSKFPDKIKQFSVFYDQKIVAGITIFDTGKVVKSQYGAANSLGKSVRALDFLFIFLIDKFKKEGKLFFDMGTVSKDNENSYNAGLLNQKEELGCSVYNQDFYCLNIV